METKYQTFIQLAEGSKFIVIPKKEDDPTGEALMYGAYLFLKIRDKEEGSIFNAISVNDGGMVSVPNDALVILVM